MLYELGLQNTQIDFTNFKLPCKNKTIGLITVDELIEYNDIFGFSQTSIDQCKVNNQNFRSLIEVYDDYTFGILNVINASSIVGSKDRIGFFLMKNLFLIVDIKDYDKSTVENFVAITKNPVKFNDTMEKTVYSFFEKLLYEDYETVEKMEFSINALEEDITDGKASKDFNHNLLHLKKELLILHNYYEQLIEIGEELKENSNDIFVEETLRYFKLFTSKVMRLNNNVQQMRESVVQLREAYDSSVDLNINTVMKMFTVVTTIFMPLTLIVGWYGMNFSNMIELKWEYGYLTVIIISIIVVALCIFFFKKKKLM